MKLKGHGIHSVESKSQEDCASRFREIMKNWWFLQYQFDGKSN
jgi:hypothetical protein